MFGDSVKIEGLLAIHNPMLMMAARVIATKLLFGVPVVILGSQIDVWVPAFVYLVLFIVILFKPLGLFGKKIVKKV